MDLLTPAELRGLIETGAEDGRLSALISAASSAIEGRCRRPLIRRSVTDRIPTSEIDYPPHDWPRLQLCAVPVSSITRITHYDRTDRTGTDYEAEDYYLVQPDDGIVEIFSSPASYDRLEAVYVAGLWANAAAVPDAVKLAAAELITLRTSPGARGLSAIQVGKVRESYRPPAPGEGPGRFPDQIEDLLRPYVHVPIG